MSDEDVQKVWAEFWAPIVMENGRLDLEQVKRELYDWHMCMSEVSKVYDHVTNGLVSKPNTAAVHVTSAHDEAVQDGRLEGQHDLLIELLADDAPDLTNKIGFAKLVEIEKRLRASQ